ncbi:MAG: LysE family translocator [Pseudomonadota bacterium]
MFAFIVASILLTLAPGPDNLFVLTQSALHGRKAGIMITLGLCTGLIVHTTLVALGVAAIFMVSTTAFVVLKLVGATYLLYLAWQLLRAEVIPTDRRKPLTMSSRQLYVRGILMNISNPKVAIFFLAFLPQFARPEAGAMPLQLFVLGLSFIVVALVIFTAIALIAGKLAGWLGASIRAQLLLNRAAALVFIGLALRLAFSSR